MSEELTRLASVVVRLAHERARRESAATGGDLVVVAMGSLGARELLYGSDLDLVYFARDAKSRDQTSPAQHARFHSWRSECL